MSTAESEVRAPSPAQSGDDEFREKLITLIPFLRAFARTLTHHRDEGDDLCQEALTKAWQARSRFEAGTNMKAWLFMILRNQFYSDKRRSWRQRPWDPELAENTLVTNGAQESTVALSELALRMRQLPPEQREALVLVSAGGFDYEETAKICGCPVGTVKSRISRARKALEIAITAPQARTAHSPKIDGVAEITSQLDRLAGGGAASGAAK